MIPISASVSQSSSATTGPIQFGNVKSGSIGLPAWAVTALAVVGVALIGGLAWLLLSKKNK